MSATAKGSAGSAGAPRPVKRGKTEHDQHDHLQQDNKYTPMAEERPKAEHLVTPLPSSSSSSRTYSPAAEELEEVLEKFNELPKRLRKKVKGWEHMERMHMTVAAMQCVLVEVAGRPGSSGRTPSVEATVAAPIFSTGQSVLHWWAPWFSTATKPLLQLKGNSRPKWFDASIVMSIGCTECVYAGRTWTEPAYQVH